MSVLIKGMEMPTSCEECPLGDSLHCQVLPSVPALWAEYTNAIREKRLHSDCPLVSVPPHGELIDLSTVNLHDGPYEYRDWVEWALEQYQDAPVFMSADPPRRKTDET